MFLREVRKLPDMYSTVKNPVKNPVLLSLRSQHQNHLFQPGVRQRSPLLSLLVESELLVLRVLLTPPTESTRNALWRWEFVE